MHPIGPRCSRAGISRTGVNWLQTSISAEAAAAGGGSGEAPENELRSAAEEAAGSQEPELPEGGGLRERVRGDRGSHDLPPPHPEVPAHRALPAAPAPALPPGESPCGPTGGAAGGRSPFCGRGSRKAHAESPERCPRAARCPAGPDRTARPPRAPWRRRPEESSLTAGAARTPAYGHFRCSAVTASAASAPGKLPVRSCSPPRWRWAGLRWSRLDPGTAPIAPGLLGRSRCGAEVGREAQEGPGLRHWGRLVAMLETGGKVVARATTVTWATLLSRGLWAVFQTGYPETRRDSENPLLASPKRKLRPFCWCVSRY